MLLVMNRIDRWNVSLISV